MAGITIVLCTTCKRSRCPGRVSGVQALKTNKQASKQSNKHNQIGSLLPSPNSPSTALPTPFADVTSAPGPLTPNLNKQLFSSALLLINSFANTTTLQPTLPRLRVHNSFTQLSLTFPNTKSQPLSQSMYYFSPTSTAALPPKIPSVKYVKFPLTK